MASIDLSGLKEASSATLPPVHLWKPDFCGDMDLIIKSNGDWIHEGSKINRPAMVRMFSRILWLEEEQYYLVTPVEKVKIEVEDAPFLVTNWDWIETEQGTAIKFTTLTEDVLVLGVDYDLWISNYKGEERPYISMRYGMKALLSRNVFYAIAEQLINIETEKGKGIGIVSAGKSYLLMQDE